MRTLAIVILAALLTVINAMAGSLLLVQGTGSNPDVAERAYAAKLTRKLSGWLDDLDVAHTVVDDETIARGVPADTHLVILGYNASPSPAEVDSLRKFTTRGGKLIVFYCSDSALADVMGLKLGDYRFGGEQTPWRGFRFLGSASPHLPASIRQTSRQIRLAWPVRTDAAIMACWEDAAGKPLSDPAWLQSRNGFWMTHVLLDDADIFNKKRMLLALIGSVDAAVWKPAAQRCLADAAGLQRYKGFDETVAAIEAAAAGGCRMETVQGPLEKAIALYGELDKLLAGRGFATVVRRSAELRDALNTALGLAQRPVPGEFRAVWDHKGVGLYPGDWPRTAVLLKDAGVTAIFVNLMWPGAAHYKSAVVPESNVMKAHGDQLSAALAAARANGLELHVWKVCWRLDQASPAFIQALEQQGRLQVSDSGQVLRWLCPSHPDNLRLEKDAVREVVRNYAIDGIHLDYIRYPDSHACYCQGCLARLAKDLGRPILHWPPLKHELLLKKQVRDWRAARMTSLVRDLRAVIDQIRPGTRLSAAVYGRYPLCADSVGQDWGAWLKKSYVDFVCPMDYTADPDQFKRYVQDQVALQTNGKKVYPGIGVTAAESRLSPLQVIEQVRILRDEGAPGFVLFDLGSPLADETLPILRLGLTAPGGAK